MRRIDPRSIKVRVEKESQQVYKKLNPKSYYAIANCRENYLKNQTEDLAQKMLQIGLFPALPKLPNALLTVTTEYSEIDPHEKNSLIHFEEDPAYNSPQGVLLTNPGPSKNPSPFVSSKINNSRARLGKKKAREEWLEDEEKLYNLLRSCCQVQLEEVKNREELFSLIFKRRVANPQETEEVGLLRDLLIGDFTMKKAKVIDHTLKKYYQRQNKFVSYRLFRENYMEVVGNVLQVLESEEV